MNGFCDSDAIIIQFLNMNLETLCGGPPCENCWEKVLVFVTLRRIRTFKENDRKQEAELARSYLSDIIETCVQCNAQAAKSSPIPITHTQE